MSCFVRDLVLACINKCKAKHAKKKAGEDKAQAKSKYEEKKVKRREAKKKRIEEVLLKE